ncbi:DUF2723 domain-containing protein [bacterium]|nr:DUF2723 domain-containing protein [bacterium]
MNDSMTNTPFEQGKLDHVDRRPHRIIAGLVLLYALIQFFATMAPTTSFWDCGEFIACSYSMGVPHPPGAPFYLLLGRLFTLIMPLPDIGLRVNALSAIVSALTVMLTYLIIVRLIRRWRGPEESVKDKVVLYGSGVIGALAFSASHSFWFNGVEAEVYAISMFFTAFVFWLAMRWMDDPDGQMATRYVLLIAYFVGLATGVHLLNVLALSPIVMIIYFQKYKFSWKGFFLALAVSFVAILVVYPGIVSGIPALLHAGLIPTILAVVAMVGVLVWAIGKRRTVMATVLASVLLVLVGYSTYTVIYVRSNLNPVINENQPDTVERLIMYLNREQYGAVGPVEVQDANPGTIARLQRSGAKLMPLAGGKILRFHILERKAPFWDYQINQMYIRYLSWQFFIGEKGQLYLFPFLIGLFGMVWQFWRDPKRGFSIGLLFLMTGLAIVFYLNQDNPQPRERDYAYVGSYFAFAIWIGIGVTALVEFVEDFMAKSSPQVKRGVAYGLVGAMFLLVPVNMLARNWDSHDRTGNFVAWDYSRNMLETCEPNAMIFTNGDNDTFPLWYLQVVEGIRTDVRVVNLSLLNTDWYIKQLRDEDPKMPIGFTDRDIDTRLTGRTDEALLLRYWPKGDRTWKIKKPDGSYMEWDVPGTMYIPTGMPGEQPGDPNFLRVQDVMILHLIEQNGWKLPIYFAVTVSQSNLIGLDPYLSMEGLTFRLHPNPAPEIDEPKLRKNLFETYAGHYRNLANPDVYYFDNVIKLLQNYRSGFLQLVFHYYRQANRTAPEAVGTVPQELAMDRFEELNAREKALYTLNMMDEIIPPETIPLTSRDVSLQIGRLYYDLGDTVRGSRYVQHSVDLAGNSAEAKLQAAFYYSEYAKDPQKAADIIDDVIAKAPTIENLFNAAAIYDRAGEQEKVDGVLKALDERNDLTTKDKLDLASFYFSKRNYEKALELYEPLKQQNPGNGEIYGGLLSVYQAMRDTPNVTNLLSEWIKAHPEDTQAQDMLNEWSLSSTNTP